MKSAKFPASIESSLKIQKATAFYSFVMNDLATSFLKNKLDTIIIMLALAKRDYMPGSANEFDGWQSNFIKKIETKQVAWNLPLVEVNVLKNFQTSDWNPKFAEGRNEADPTRKQRKAKNDSHKKFEKMLRDFVQKNIRRNNLIKPADLVSMKITVVDKVRTGASEVKTSPEGRVEKFNHLEQIIRIINPDDTESNQRPAGIKHTRVYRCIRPKDQPEPVSIKEYEFYKNATKHLVSSTFDESDMGKMAYYILQYENTKGATGLPCKSFKGMIP